MSQPEENVIKTALENELSCYFDIEKEVKGTYLENKQVRIDYILTANKTLLAECPEFTSKPFGLEVKSPCDSSDRCKKAICLVNQVMVYSNTYFAKHGRLQFILIYPGLKVHFKTPYSSPDFDRGVIHGLKRVMGKFHCGELAMPMSRDGKRLVEMRFSDTLYWRNTTGIGPGWAFAERRWEGTHGTSTDCS
jgi:hypothetical protein